MHHRREENKSGGYWDSGAADAKGKYDRNGDHRSDLDYDHNTTGADMMVILENTALRMQTAGDKTEQEERFTIIPDKTPDQHTSAQHRNNDLDRVRAKEEGIMAAM
ncbi:hypothetical protein GGI23_004880 [Coemansia sp. RSA 2559]|nr:hypothetical protein GGI23_004880 [Coemansia sp. RSA 2559]